MTRKLRLIPMPRTKPSTSSRPKRNNTACSSSTLMWWESQGRSGARRVFEFAKKLGARAITIEPSADQIELIEKLIKEYNIAAGIHCHPKRAEKPDYKLWDP